MTESPPGSEEPADATASTATAVSAEPIVEEQTRQENQRRGPEGRSLGFLRELPVLIVVAFVLALVIKTFVFQAFYIPSASMEPALLPGDRVLVNKAVYHLHEPRRGDIIVFQNPAPAPRPGRGVVGGALHWLSEGLGVVRPENEDFIKRVIGLPGETVEYRDGIVYIDGGALAEPYLRGLPKDLRHYGPVSVPEGMLFVMGDNRQHSSDSRFGLGFIPEADVVGRAFVTIWPVSRLGWTH